MAISSYQDSNLFSENDWEVESNIPDDLFANEPGLDTLDDFSLDVDESYLAMQTWDDLIPDSDLLADNDVDCSFSSLSSRSIRARSDSDSCVQAQEKTPEYLVVKTAEDVKKYWCSETNVLGFTNIPVCSLLPDQVGVTPTENTRWLDLEPPSTPSGFFTLIPCRISKFLSARPKRNPCSKFTTLLKIIKKNSRTLTRSFANSIGYDIVTPANYIICADDRAYCCNRFLPFEVDKLTADRGTGFLCSPAFRMAFQE